MGRAGIRVGTAVTLLAFAGVLLVALPLQWVWWRTAEQSSVELVDALSSQIAGTVRREWWDRVVQTESAYDVAALLLDAAMDDSGKARALTAALAASQVPSAIAYDHSGLGRRFARRDAGGKAVALTTPTSAGPQAPAGPPAWREAAADPAVGGPAVVYGGALPSGGSLAVSIGLDRFSTLLGAIPVGQTGAAFVVDAAGALKAVPAIGPIAMLGQPVAAAAAVVAARPREAVNIVEARRLVVAGEGYHATYSPLEFNGWQLIVLVPEAEFLGGIERTQRRTLVGLVVLALALGMASAALAKSVLSRPLTALAADLSRIERFDLEEIPYRPGRLVEFDRLSAAIARMAKGLADFGKFIPTDLVRMLLADGVRAVPGGETRELSVMFADVAGFTNLSERMGTAVIDVVSRYLDIASRAVESTDGAVDKFIGDAVMALWGAPRPDPDQARHACLAALAIVDSLKVAGVVDDRGAPLRVRIGIHSGLAVVGNIGSTRRLNYTAIGDTVNFASRLEGANKVFGTTILISETTRIAAGPGLVTREIADIAVVGKASSVKVHELIGAHPPEDATWLGDYAAALDAFRKGDFPAVGARLGPLLAVRPDDGPGRWLKASAERLLAEPPPADWRGVVVLDSK
jgi:adenylate cyclase